MTKKPLSVLLSFLLVVTPPLSAFAEGIDTNAHEEFSTQAAAPAEAQTTEEDEVKGDSVATQQDSAQPEDTAPTKEPVSSEDPAPLE